MGRSYQVPPPASASAHRFLRNRSRLFHCDSQTLTTLASLTYLSQSRKQRRRRKIKHQEKEQQKQCVSDTLSSLLTPFSASSSWLEVSGGLLTMKVSGMWQKRSKTLRSGTMSRRRPPTSTSTMPYWRWAGSPSLLLSLDIVEPKRRISASSLSTASASSSSSFYRSPPSSSSTLMTPTLISSRSPSAHRLTN